MTAANLFEYHKNRENFSKKSKAKQFVRGLEEIEDETLWPDFSTFQKYEEPASIERRTSGVSKKRKSTGGGEGLSGASKKKKVSTFRIFNNLDCIDL